MSVKKKPLVVVTRKLPDSIETRMRELFDARLNLDDTPMTPEQIAEADPHRRRAGADRHRQDHRGDAQAARLQAAHDRQFRQRRRQYRRHGGACARHHGDQHAESADRRHRRHDHGADPRGAAPAGRGHLDPAPRARTGRRLVADLDARRTGSAASASASSAWAASARRSPGARGPSACRSTITIAAPSAPVIAEELGATYWESLDQMLARMDIISVNCPHTPATFHLLLSARRLKLIRKEAYIVNTARGEVIDEDTLSQADRNRRHRRLRASTSTRTSQRSIRSWCALPALASRTSFGLTAGSCS